MKHSLSPRRTRTQATRLTCFLPVVILCCASHAQAADGAFDASFATTGRETFPVSSSGEDFVHSVHETSDGKLLMAGTCLNEICLARVRSNGALDTTYGPLTLGTASVDQFPNAPTASTGDDMILLSDDRALVVGSDSSTGQTGLYVIRADGSGFDTSVAGGKGYIADIFGPSNPVDSSSRIVRQTDGKLIIAQSAYQSSSGVYLVVARILADFSGLDTSFGNQGLRSIAFGVQTGSNNVDQLAAVDVQSDGKIVVGATSITSADTTSISVARLLPNGQLDTTFGENADGKFNFQNGALNLAMSDLHVDASGRVILGGRSDDSTTGYCLIGRLTPGGLLDASFGSGGFATYQINNMKPQGVVRFDLTSDSIIAAGYLYRSASSSAQYFGLTRLNMDGSLASSFGNQGSSFSSFSGTSSTDIATDLVVTSKGIVLVGYSQQSGGIYEFGAARIQYEHLFANSFE